MVLHVVASKFFCRFFWIDQQSVCTVPVALQAGVRGLFRGVSFFQTPGGTIGRLCFAAEQPERSRFQVMAQDKTSRNSKPGSTGKKPTAMLENFECALPLVQLLKLPKGNIKSVKAKHQHRSPNEPSPTIH